MSELKQPILTTQSDTQKKSEVPASLTAVEESSKHIKSTLLSTALVTVTNSIGQQIQCRALLDNGSQANFITKRLVNKLGLSHRPCITGIEGIGKTQSRIAQRVNLQLSSNATKFSSRIEAHILPEIISKQPSSSIHVSSWNIPSNLQLADPKFH